MFVVLLLSSIVCNFCSSKLTQSLRLYPFSLTHNFASATKFQDLIRLLNSDDEGSEDELDDACGYEIDTEQDYKETLTKIMNQIYSKREKLSKNPAPIMLILLKI